MGLSTVQSALLPICQGQYIGDFPPFGQDEDPNIIQQIHQLSSSSISRGKPSVVALDLASTWSLDSDNNLQAQENALPTNVLSTSQRLRVRQSTKFSVQPTFDQSSTVAILESRLRRTKSASYEGDLVFLKSGQPSKQKEGNMLDGFIHTTSASRA